MRNITLLLLSVLCLPVASAGQESRRIEYPPRDVGVETLAARREAQLQTRSSFRAFTGFRFTDRVLTSGIDFEHRSVEDSAKTWMPVHYDHGNGVLVADVDGDDRYDVYFLSQIGSNRLYRNLGDGTFEDITAAAHVGLPDRVSVTGAFGDVDNDGDPDLYVTTVRTGNVLFLNDGKGHFEDVTAGSGLEYVGHSSGAAFLDYDRDGLLDLFVANVGVYTTDAQGPGGFYHGLPDAFEGHRYPDRTETSRLYRNLGDHRFRDVSEAMDIGDTGWNGDAAVTDLNGDLYPDLYILNMQGDDHYLENQGGKRFVDRTAELFPKTPWGAMGVKFFDYNNDGRLDLFITDMHSDMHEAEVRPLYDEKVKYIVPLDDGENNIAGNAFYVQREDGSFEEISDRIGTETFWPWGLSVGDLNADGFEDVFVASSMNFPFRYGVNSLLLNDLGTVFRDSEFLLGVEPRRDGRTKKALFELDCPGVDSDHPVCRRLGGHLTIVGSLGSRTSVIYDLDGDGDLDILTGEFNDVPQVLVSDLTERRPVHYLKIVLRGTRSNRDGLDARVRVTAGESTYTRFRDGNSGYMSHSLLPLYFGLGEREKADRIEVLWPSGRRQVVTDGIPANGTLEIVEE